MKNELPEIADLHDRVLRLETQNRLFKRVAAALPIVSVFAFLVLRAPTTLGQGSPVQQSPKLGAEQSVGLASKIAALSRQTAHLQQQVDALLGDRWIDPNGSGAQLQDLKNAVEQLRQDDPSELRSDLESVQKDVRDLKDTVDQLKVDDPDDKISSLESEVNGLKTFRSAVCSLSWSGGAYFTLHGGAFPPCPAF